MAFCFRAGASADASGAATIAARTGRNCSDPLHGAVHSWVPANQPGHILTSSESARATGWKAILLSLSLSTPQGPAVSDRFPLIALPVEKAHRFPARDIRRCRCRRKPINGHWSRQLLLGEPYFHPGMAPLRGHQSKNMFSASLDDAGLGSLLIAARFLAPGGNLDLAGGGRSSARG